MSEINIIAIVQARMGSSRLPDKVCLDIGGYPMLVRVLERTRRSRMLSDIVVATTTSPTDDPIEKLCQERDYACFRGSLYDLLDRYYQTACQYEADVIVRITADCPLIDPAVIDHTVMEFLGGSFPDEMISSDMLPWDFAANRLPPPWKRTYPIGLDTEVCTFAALQRAWKEAEQPYQREHVMPYLYDLERSKHYSSLDPNLKERTIPPNYFRVLQVDHDPDLGFYRWTVDTSDDLELVRKIYAYFGNRDDFIWLDVLDLFQKHPELADINAKVQHKSVHDVDQRNQAAL
jgi:spore coat polysaccharide biosynthesis protein SpsF